MGPALAAEIGICGYGSSEEEEDDESAPKPPFAPKAEVDQPAAKPKPIVKQVAVPSAPVSRWSLEYDTHGDQEGSSGSRCVVIGWSASFLQPLC